MYVCVCMYLCMYVCMSVGEYVCMHVCMYACTYVRTYVRVYVCIYVCSRLFDITYHNEGNCSWTSNTYYGDASGGKYIEFSKLRRVGCSIAQISNDLSLIFGASFGRPGPVQSEGRGEFLALSVLVKHLLPYAEVVFVTDNLSQDL